MTAKQNHNYSTSMRLSPAVSTARSELYEFFQTDPGLSHLNMKNILNLAIFYIHEMTDAELKLLNSNVSNLGKKTSGTPLRMTVRFQRQCALPLIDRVGELTGRSKVSLTEIVSQGVLGLRKIKNDRPMELVRIMEGLKHRQRALKFDCC